MATRKKRCRFCSAINPKEATVCELCGRSLSNRQHIMVKSIIGIVLGLALIVVIYIMQKTPLYITGSSHAPRLELISSAGYASLSGDMIVEGKVRNIGGDMLKDIQVVVSWYDKQGNKLSEAKSDIYLNPVMSFQVSPFRVSMPRNPQMGRYDIKFITRAGDAIYTRDRREKTEG